MKIVDIKTYLTMPVEGRAWLFVEVETDEGVTGLGECTDYFSNPHLVGGIEAVKPLVIGVDPANIEEIWQRIFHAYSDLNPRGYISHLISAIDIALWDIAGKHFGVPAYQLLGGKTRDRARVYYHVFGETRDELVQAVADARRAGFTAVGHLSPFFDEPREVPYFKTHVDKIRDAIDTIRACREAAGDEVDLCVEIHRRLTPAEAVTLARGIEPYHPMFYEDPILPDNLNAMGRVSEKISIPIATGERLHTIHEFQMLLERDAVQYVRPDVCLAGGLTHCKKIAALAEANYVGVVPHNPLSPVSTAACLQLAACIPNFAIQEYPTGEDRPPKSEIVKTPLKMEGGYLVIPDAPGIGIELADDAAQRFPPVARGEIDTRLHVDGSVVDQ